MRFAAAVLAGALVIGACSEDDPDTTTVLTTTTQPAPIDGGLDIATPGDSFAVPLPSLGFGLALPAGFEAVRLTDGGLDDLEAQTATAGVGAFIAAARRAESRGAVFYAAGVDRQDRVAEVSVSVSDGLGASIEGLRAEAEEAAAAVAVGGVVTTEVEVDGRNAVVLRFDVAGEILEDGASVTTSVAEFVIAGNDRVYRAVITAEFEQATLELADLLTESFTLGD